MANQHQKSKKQPTRSGNPRVCAAKNIQAADAAQKQKKKAAVHTVHVHGGGLDAAVGNGMGIDSSGSSRPRRRSSRLNGIQATTESPIQTKHTSAAVASRKAPRRSYTPLDDGTQSDAQGGLEEVQDLRQQLQEERNKNRLLRRAAEKQTSQTLEKIAKPSGSVGSAGFSLITEMKLDRTNPSEKVLYNDILASVRALAISAGIDFGRRYKDQSITKLSKLMVAAREAEPYLTRFEDDWATGQIIRQYINGKRKYENAKASGKVKNGVMQKGMTLAWGPASDSLNMRMSLGDSDGNGSGSEGEEWQGINGFSNRDPGDMEFEGNDED